eukprot:g43704.t1
MDSGHQHTRLQPIQFTPCDVKKRLETLDTAKAMSPDNIPAIVLKTCAPELAIYPSQAVPSVASRTPSKTENSGYQGQTLCWLKSYLTYRRGVVVGGQTSELQSISAGVPQGIVLGLTIFSCSINDLPSMRSEVEMLADEYTVFSTIRDSDAEAVH